MADPRSHRRWQRLRAHILATHPPVCHICNQPIDLSLPGTNEMGPTVDHVVPITRGGAMWDPTNLRPAHRKHNGSKGDREHKPPRSREW
jgi:5-methylcytosine-specific restriction endonuclease McrA